MKGKRTHYFDDERHLGMEVSHVQQILQLVICIVILCIGALFIICNISSMPTAKSIFALFATGIDIIIAIIILIYIIREPKGK